MHPFGRASPSVINRLIKAGSLLSPTCSSGDIRAIPSISQAATPMKPRANLRNRTRQPKGCANRIAKPARQCRTSQNHLMMIILNKTGATTVAQLDFETLAIHTQSETRGCRRHVLCANFSKTRALFLLLSHRPQQKGRAGGSPTGVFVAWCSVGTFVRLRFGVSRGIARARSFVCDHVRARRGHVVAMAWPSCPGRRDVPVHGLWRGVAVAVAPAVFSSPSCGCDTPMSASVCNGFGVVYVDSICLTFVRRV